MAREKNMGAMFTVSNLARFSRHIPIRSKTTARNLPASALARWTLAPLRSKLLDIARRMKATSNQWKYMKDPLTRRGFIRSAAVGSAALSWLGARHQVLATDAARPALLGGAPVHQGGWSPWPIWREAWEPDVIKVLRSGKWFRGD